MRRKHPQGILVDGKKLNDEELREFVLAELGLGPEVN